MNRHLKKHAELERLFGADFLPLSKRSVDGNAPRPGPPVPATRGIPARPERPPAPPSATSPVASVDPSAARLSPQEPPEYREFREKTLACTKCGLCQTRTQVVFGVGPLGAPVMFIGEAPGEDEDRQGEPFVGRAGQLLTRTLKKIGVERARVYIANILKCRPPQNRTPQVDEMAACMPYLMRQIQLVRPKILCLLGNVAMQALLNTKQGISRLRGKYVEAHGAKVFPTFHPAYVLRNMNELGLFETDLRKVCRDAGLI